MTDLVEDLRAEIARLKRALAGHLFDREAISTREAIRIELIEQGFADREALTAELASVRAELADYKDRVQVWETQTAGAVLIRYSERYGAHLDGDGDVWDRIGTTRRTTETTTTEGK